MLAWSSSAAGRVLLLISCLAAYAQSSAPSARFVTVQEGVRLEVLDWGGTGRALILLAGSGNTAHVFDEFAPKLKHCCHVYGITRRGFGASSQPSAGYDEGRLAEDILQVLEALRINDAVLVGHSMAGGEMTVLASQHPGRVGGLVYVDALFDVADYPASDPAYRELFKKLPPDSRPAPAPATQEESRSWELSRARQLRNEGFAFPESELRNSYETNTDGSKGKYKTPPDIFRKIGDGALKRDYSKIRAPILSIEEGILAPGDYTSADKPPTDEERSAIDAFRAATKAFSDRWKTNLQNGPHTVKFVDLPDSGHYVFLTRETEVIREIEAFVAGLR